MQAVRTEFPCRLIIDGPAAAAWNMAVDEALLSDAAQRHVATLRLYQWDSPTLSLGYFQRYADRYQHSASRDSAVVRRQTGGGAILHDRELTYSLALPATHALTRHAEQLYTAVHEAMIAALAPRIAVAAPGWRFQLRSGVGTSLPRDEPFLCFQREARGDILVGPPELDDQRHLARKVMGSAQRRRHGAVLQHGSLILEKSAAAPEILGLCELTGVALRPGELVADIREAFSSALGMLFEESRLPSDLGMMIRELESRKYAAPRWTNRR